MSTVVSPEGSQVLDPRVQELLDRQEIIDCMGRYIRGVDRVDEELIRSAYHEDAVDHHAMVTGSVDDFLAHWLPQQSAREVSQHYTSNSTIDLDGDVAHVETYFVFYCKMRGEPEMTVSGGRYADRFERRDSGWKIALRVVIPEWTMQADGAASTDLLATFPIGRKDRLDPTYARPLLGPEST